MQSMRSGVKAPTKQYHISYQRMLYSPQYTLLDNAIFGYGSKLSLIMHMFFSLTIAVGASRREGSPSPPLSGKSYAPYFSLIARSLI